MNPKETYTYTAVFTRESVGGYSVRFPQLDGCFTQGEDFESACRMAVEAMSLHLYAMEEDGEPIPEPVMEYETTAGEMLVPITAWMPPFRDKMRKQSAKKH